MQGRRKREKKVEKSIIVSPHSTRRNEIAKLHPTPGITKLRNSTQHPSQPSKFLPAPRPSFEIPLNPPTHLRKSLPYPLRLRKSKLHTPPKLTFENRNSAQALPNPRNSLNPSPNPRNSPHTSPCLRNSLPHFPTPSKIQHAYSSTEALEKSGCPTA